MLSGLNCCKSVSFVVILGDLKTAKDRQIFLDANCLEKRVISEGKVIYTFDDGSFLFCDGKTVKARDSSEDMSEFFH